MTRQELYVKACALPLSSGVYIMKDRLGEVVYVGKSKKLRNRVSQYFAAIPHSIKTERMVNAVDDFDYILTDSESEALILENIQIKKHLPKYNILLKDDKNYPYLKIGTGEYPRLSVVRKRGEKGEYFGPYSNAGSATQLADTVSKLFTLPSCKRSFPKDIGKERPCLNYHIGRCVGICTGKVSREEYGRLISDVRSFLKGNQEKVIASLTEKMYEASEKTDFERAAAYRDSINRIKALRQKQKVQTDTEKNLDVLAVYDGEDGACITLATVREGCFNDKLSYRFGADNIVDGESVASAIYRIYEDRDDVPPRILTNTELSEDSREALEAELTKKAGRRVRVDTAKIGENKKLCDMVLANAREYVLQYNEKQRREGKTLVSLAKLLGLEVLPERIEAYDVSNWGDDFISIGMIVVLGGAFSKSHYRSFNAKQTETQNDCASMAEAVERRIKRGLDGDESFLPLPDLILADGGETQVGAVKAVLQKLSVDIPVFGMVKDRHHKTRTLTSGDEEISIAGNGEIFGFIYKIQEEVHRFSIKRMDSRRREKVKKSSLEELSGIGKTRAVALLSHFGGINELRAASVEEISAVKGFSEALSKKLYEQLHGKGEE